MKTGIITIGNNVFETLVAVNEKEQSKGLMFQTPPVSNMSFVYKQPKINKFWMHNTPSELDIIFCCNGIVTEICKGEPYSTKILGSNMFSNLVIEFQYGTVEKFNIKVGDRVELND